MVKPPVTILVPPDHSLRPDRKLRYMPFLAPTNDNPGLANMLWVRAVRLEARRRGIPFGPDQDRAPAAVDEDLARFERTAVYRPRRAAPPPDPAQAYNPTSLVKAMRELRRWNRNPQPTLRELERRAAELGHAVSRPTLARALNGQVWPTLRTLTGFVLACGLNEREWRAWASAWHKVSDGANQREISATLMLGNTAVRLPTDTAWWRGIQVEAATDQEIEAEQARRAEWNELYAASDLLD